MGARDPAGFRRKRPPPPPPPIMLRWVKLRCSVPTQPQQQQQQQQQPMSRLVPAPALTHGRIRRGVAVGETNEGCTEDGPVRRGGGGA